MGKKRYKYPVTRKPLGIERKQALDRHAWEELAASPAEREAYLEFTLEMQRANSVAQLYAARTGRSASEFVDMRRALSVVAQHPNLTRYIRAAARAQHRDHLLAETFIPELLKNGSPTQSNPQASSGLGAAWAGSQNAPLSVTNAKRLRDLSEQCEWARGAINLRRDQIGRADIAVLPMDETRPFNQKAQKQTMLILEQPNELRQNYTEMMASSVEDLLVLDRGVLSKNMTLGSRHPVALYAEDGSTIAIYPAWSGDPDEPRYVYSEPGTGRKVPLRNDEAIVMMMNPATYRFGLSIMQVLFNTVVASIRSAQMASQIVEQKPPTHLVQIPGISLTQAEQLAELYLTTIAGRKELFFLGGQDKANVTALGFSAKDNQFLEIQLWLARIICALFRCMPQQLGITMDVNKATGETQNDIQEDTGLIPLLLTVEMYLNREFLADFAPKLPYGRVDLTALNLRVVFPQISEAARMLHAERTIALASEALAGLPSMTINQALAMRGEEPVQGGDTFYMASMNGAIPFLSYNGELGDFVKDPTAIDPALGGQDAAGGPEENMEGPHHLDNDDPVPPAPKPGSGGSDDDADDQGQQDSGAAKGKGKSAARQRQPRQRKTFVDVRPAGKAWRPGHIQHRSASGKPASRGRLPADLAEHFGRTPHEIVQARITLAAQVAQTFEGAAKRGAESLRKLEETEGGNP